MWDCQNEGCGCKGIAADLPACPMCWKERDMPKITVAGASNAGAGPGGPGHVPAAEVSDAAPAEVAVPEQQETVVAPADPAARPPAAAPKAAWVDHVVAAGLDRGEAESMKKDELRAWTAPQTPEPAAPAQDGPASELTITADAQVTRAAPEAAP